ncbi:hypothetical protein [Cytobacillus firmus]|uniref:Uncharacterized protein n=1 Tax=Cytobacillus firmus DS1 TaxID=1307436 RepID=W7L0R6_CYTFI|nr:hypothetical protein [Cytobacillus firmus]EWG08627.1 hypothetical protein PBF_23298 [Cytobacillus firmus DS1]
MKKLLVVMLFLGLFTFTGTSETEASSSPCSKYSGQSRIWWDGAELKLGQIGRLTIVKNTSLFKLEGEKRTFERTLKAGESYRIYAFKPGMLSVGGGFYVDRNEKVKYETPSKTKLDAVACINGKHPSQSKKIYSPILGKVTLGMSKQQVKEQSSGILSEETSDRLVYQNVNILGYTGMVIYVFENNALVAVNVYHDIMESVDDLNLLEAYFVTMYEKIIPYYGDPVSLDTDWLNDTGGYNLSAYWITNDHNTLLTVQVTYDYDTYGGLRISITE